MRGIDVYWRNGFPLNEVVAKAYKESDFVIVKATQGINYSHTDYFYKMMDQAIKDNKLVGAYHYASGNDPIKEADYFISVVTKYIGNCILALDWEQLQNKAWKNTTWAKKFIDRVYEKTKVKCFLYANMDGIAQCKNLANTVPLWFAGYPKDENSWAIPKWPNYYTVKPWKTYEIWQYTSGKETVDRNLSNMLPNDWREYAKGDYMSKTTAQDIINIMESWKGLSRKDQSHKAIIDLYNSYEPLARDYKVSYTDNYCAVTVSAAFIKANAVDLIGGTECGVQRFIDIFKKKGIWNEDGTITPKPGYIICYNWDDNTQPNDGWADHIGIVVSVKDDIITVIEGNYRDEVAERKIKVGDGHIRGYAIPQYATDDIIVPVLDNSKRQLLQLVVDTLLGKYGTGNTRKQKLGADYTRVQEVINHVLKTSILQLAKEALNGDYGNGETRKIIFGNKYVSVQKKINELVKSK